MCRQRMGILPSLVSHHPAGVDKQKEMVGLTAAGLILRRVRDQTDDDFHREGLSWKNKSSDMVQE